jgi:hypothetical protein
MKPLFALFVFAAVASAGPILITDPIFLTGSGTWSFSFIGGDMVQSASASGSNGVDSASFAYSSDCAGAGSPSVGVNVNDGCASAIGIGAAIDDVFLAIFFQFSSTEAALDFLNCMIQVIICLPLPI